MVNNFENGYGKGTLKKAQKIGAGTFYAEIPPKMYRNFVVGGPPRLDPPQWAEHDSRGASETLLIWETLV